MSWRAPGPSSRRGRWRRRSGPFPLQRRPVGAGHSVGADDHLSAGDLVHRVDDAHALLLKPFHRLRLWMIGPSDWIGTFFRPPPSRPPPSSPGRLVGDCDGALHAEAEAALLAIRTFLITRDPGRRRSISPPPRRPSSSSSRCTPRRRPPAGESVPACCPVRRAAGRRAGLPRTTGRRGGELELAPPGAHGGRGVEEELRLRVGKDDRADVPPLEDDAPVRPSPAVSRPAPHGPGRGPRPRRPPCSSPARGSHRLHPLRQEDALRPREGAERKIQLPGHPSETNRVAPGTPKRWPPARPPGTSRPCRRGSSRRQRRAVSTPWSSRPEGPSMVTTGRLLIASTRQATVEIREGGIDALHVRHLDRNLRRRPRIRNDIAIRWSPRLSHGRPEPPRPVPPPIDRPGIPRNESQAKRGSRHRRDPVRLLDAELFRAADLRAAGGERRRDAQDRNFVDQAGTASGPTRAARAPRPERPGLPPAPPLDTLPDLADVGPHPRSTSRIPVRNGFTPTPRITSDEPGSRRRGRGRRRPREVARDRHRQRIEAIARATVTAFPSRTTPAPIAASIRSVWSRDRIGSTTVTGSRRTAGEQQGRLHLRGSHRHFVPDPPERPPADAQGRKPVPVPPRINAPIRVRGSITRPIGRRRRYDRP